MRAAIYARYSSDLQREASIEDQVRLCRERVVQMRGKVVGVYTDAAISGSQLQNRSGIRSLLDDARAHPCPFDIVIAEALDRLSRDQEDIAGLFKRLAYLDIRIHTLAEGEINELHVGLKGTMNALFLKDLAAKVRRGQRGRAEARRAAGGLSYGYSVVRKIGPDGEIERGQRDVDPVQAAVIRRSFEEYVAGRSPRAIAADLNREGVPSPRGGAWNASTINGHRRRLHGILQNPLYDGRMIYGRLTYRKNPETGARELRMVPPEKWVHVEMPEWQIVPIDIWEAAQKMRAEHAAHRPHEARRPRHLLSGLVRCGVCGGAYTMRSSDRLGCVAHREKGTCSSNRTITLVELERRVLGGLKERLLAPEVFAEFAEEYSAELRRIRAGYSEQRTAVEHQLINTSRRIDRIVDAIAEGTASRALKAKLADLEAEKERLEAERQGLDATSEVADLEATLKRCPAERAAVSQILRSLIERIVVHPGERRGETEIEVEGSIVAILDFASQAQGEQTPNRSVGVVVPRGGIEPPTHGFSVRCSTN